LTKAGLGLEARRSGERDTLDNILDAVENAALA
jgi:hypothetical protein